MQPRVVLGALGHGWLFLSLMFLDPIILRRLLDGAGADSAAAARRNLGYAAALSASMFVRVACMEVCFFGSVRAMNNCRTAIVPLVFRAAVGGRTDEDSGKLTNLMATDADKLGRWSWTLFFAAQWSFAVVSLPAVAYCMYDLLGAGQDKRAKFPTSKAPFSAVFHSFRLIFGRAIISRNGLEAWMLFPERARAERSR